MTLSTTLEGIRKTEAGKEFEREPVGKDAFIKAVEEAITSPKGLVIAAITSNTQASFESDLTPYGAGKTTLALTLSYRFNHFDPETGRYWDTGLDKDDPRNWETVKDNTWYYPSRTLQSMQRAVEEHRRIKTGIWDDVQYTAPASTGAPTALLELQSDLTTDRPEIGFLLFTMPNLMSVHSVVRSLVQYELIVYSRGRYEVQHVTYRKNFANPKKDWMRLEYVSGLGKDEQREADFGPLPPHMQTWYDNWRTEQKAPKRQGTIRRLERFEKRSQGNVEEPPKPAPAPLKPTVKKGWGED